MKYYNLSRIEVEVQFNVFLFEYILETYMGKAEFSAITPVFSDMILQKSFKYADLSRNYFYYNLFLYYERL